VCGKSRRRAEAAGCEFFLTKPVDPDALLRAVRGSTGSGEVGAVAGLGFREAEQFLDWLEGRGCTRLETAIEGGAVTVRCLCPPGLRLLKDEDGVVRLREA